ncbi:hypothetical protein BJX63DRAFT_425585 [Aspergillus granulosus]|uniref:Uncharacterized protein n=1 Tax=Aspergillus granulosus TaxID=176169 RepID=A0ABR4GVI1_9EURO
MLTTFRTLLTHLWIASAFLALAFDPMGVVYEVAHLNRRVIKTDDSERPFEVDGNTFVDDCLADPPAAEEESSSISVAEDEDEDSDSDDTSESATTEPDKTESEPAPQAHTTIPYDSDYDLSPINCPSLGSLDQTTNSNLINHAFLSASMLATVAPMQQTPNRDHSHYPWTPTRPSPLSPRGSSASATTAITTTPIQQPQLQTQSPPSLFTFYPSPASSPLRGPSDTTATSTSPNYATRYTTTISKPLLAHSTKRTFTASNTPAARSARRNAFLNRVKQDRNTGRFEARAEQLAFMEGVAEQKEWDERMRRRAEVEALLPWEFGLEDEEEMYNGLPEDAEIQALDEYLEQEHALEMDLLEQMQHPPQDHTQGNAAASFSDDEYDDIFMDLADPSPSQDMDMSG